MKKNFEYINEYGTRTRTRLCIQTSMVTRTRTRLCIQSSRVRVKVPEYGFWRKSPTFLRFQKNISNLLFSSLLLLLSVCIHFYPRFQIFCISIVVDYMYCMVHCSSVRFLWNILKEGAQILHVTIHSSLTEIYVMRSSTCISYITNCNKVLSYLFSIHLDVSICFRENMLMHQYSQMISCGTCRL